MKREEIDQNPELKNQLVREIEEKAQESHDFLGAEIDVLKAHGIEFDEDALRAAAVEKMKLNEENLENVSGGYDYWCVKDYACHYVYKHPKEHAYDNCMGRKIKAEACFGDWCCMFVNHS